MIQIREGLYFYAEDREACLLSAGSQVPRDDFSDLIGDRRRDRINYGGPGLYRAHYRIFNPVDHGLRVEPVGRGYVSRLIQELGALLDKTDAA